METLNQFVARHTYPKFMETLGGEVRYADEILEKGYGYGTWVKNFRALLRKLNLKEPDHLPAFEAILYKRKYNRVQENLSTYLAKVTDFQKEAINEVLGFLDRYPEGFEGIMDVYLG